MKLVNRLSKLFNNYNRNGIPVPMVRDPATGVGSITATMAVVAFGVAVLLLAGKAATYFGEVDYNNVIWLLGVSVGAYLGRRFQKNGKSFELDGDAEYAPKKEKSEDAKEN